jgi:hypothetical protein
MLGRQQQSGPQDRQFGGSSTSTRLCCSKRLPDGLCNVIYLLSQAAWHGVCVEALPAVAAARPV